MPGLPDQRQVAERLIDEALGARHHRQVDAFEDRLDLLAEGTGGPAGVQVVNRALFGRLLQEVANAWRRGWEPAEIVRAVRRDGSAGHGRLVTDVIAARLREFPAASVPPRWQVQLAALDAVVWWEHDDLFPSLWGARHSVDRTTTVQTMIDVLLVLLTMMPVEPAGPLPGDPQPVVADAGRLDQRMLDRVRALLAKAESTDFPEEAEAYTAKAQELMTRHRIDHALLAARSGARDRPATRRVAVDNPYEMPKSLLLQVVAEANSCRAVWMKRIGLVSVIGFAPDLDATELLFTSLLVQATRAMTGSGSRTDAYGRSTTRSFRQSFLTSYAHRIGERLTTASDEVTEAAAAAETGRELLPVLAARTEAVREAVAEQFPEMTTVPAAASNHEGWAAGRAAADRAVLNGRDELSNR
ncbi:hypothetical protein BJ973_001577 [Actinoplanes tereljensis]|uniref:DUF2786 domain-containing protein n=1 Tax=Paractinoplanes tereljensis TaxID=571912 RepID=UPI001EF1E75D|nr:DUF2786 domain-containing protein [Actinoplanes tereljensis]